MRTKTEAYGRFELPESRRTEREDISIRSDSAYQSIITSYPPEDDPLPDSLGQEDWDVLQGSENAYRTLEENFPSD